MARKVLDTVATREEAVAKFLAQAERHLTEYKTRAERVAWAERQADQYIKSGLIVVAP